MSTEIAFLFGYLVFSKISFLHLVDLTFVVWVLSDALVYVMFALPALYFNFRVSLIEDDIDIQFAMVASLKTISLPLLYIFMLTTVFVDGRFNVGFIQYLVANMVILFLTAGFTGIAGLARLWPIIRKKPRKILRLFTVTQISLTITRASWFLWVIFIVWVGHMRFDYVSQERMFEYSIGATTYTCALIGKNSVGLIILDRSDGTRVIPEEALTSLKVLN